MIRIRLRFIQIYIQNKRYSTVFKAQLFPFIGTEKRLDGSLKQGAKTNHKENREGYHAADIRRYELLYKCCCIQGKRQKQHTDRGNQNR